MGLFPEAMLSVFTEEVRRHETSRWPLIYLERVLARVVIESSKKLSFVVAVGQIRYFTPMDELDGYGYG